MTARPKHPDELSAWMRDVNQEFVIRLTRDGRRWHASIVHGIAILGEPGSSTYTSRSQERTTRKAMRTVGRVIANQHLSHARITIERS